MDEYLVLTIVFYCCVVAIFCTVAFRLLSAMFGWIAKHMLGVVTVLIAIPAFVLVGEGAFFAVICVGGTVAIIRWLLNLKKKD